MFHATVPFPIEDISVTYNCLELSIINAKVLVSTSAHCIITQVRKTFSEKDVHRSGYRYSFS